MNRRNFLALIPALGSVPLIAKEVVKKDDDILIVQPQQLDMNKVRGRTGNFYPANLFNSEVFIVRDNNIIAYAPVDSVSLERHVHSYTNGPMVFESTIKCVTPFNPFLESF